ncbi:MAG: sugar phosphate isomerase/epimerase [Verrucomicrobia bacterium]|nr:sugar phosphate isomerase/epimerase [Verrucomicrobiota bacterium]
MKPMNRREALFSMAGGCSAMLFGGAASGWCEPVAKRSQLGIVIYALGIHQRNNWCGRHAGSAPALAFLEECHRFGAGGIQCSFGPKDAPHIVELRRRAERYEMRVEAILNPPGNEVDAGRFENDVKLAKEAGASVARTVIIPGRRYERFKTLAEFREFEQRGLRSLQLAEPVVARHKFRLGVENHKDQRIAEKLDTLKRVGSEWIGLCVDVANNFALMEDPLETVRAFAPFAFTVHIKDQAIQPDAEGFLLTDVALGEGFLDLPVIVKALRDAKPDIRFNLETITRDPIKVPVLTAGYWATLADAPARELARTMRVLKTRAYPAPLAAVSKLPADQQLALERRNAEHSLAYAREKLGL